MESSLQYLQLDYTAQRTALIDRLKERWPSDWSDFSQNAIGMVLVDLMAWSLTNAAYANHATVAEAFTSSMRLRESAIRLGNTYGYRLRGPTAATAMCTAELGTVQTTDVTIPKRTLVTVKLSDNTRLSFETVADVSISAGNLTPYQHVLAFRYGTTYTGDSSELPTQLAVTAGSRYVDCVDTSIDLTSKVSAGYDLLVNGVYYNITALACQSGTTLYNRMVLAAAYAASTATISSADVYERRIALVQGQTVTDNYSTPSLPGDFYCVQMTRTQVVEDSLTVTVDGTAWSQRQFGSVYTASSQVYTLRLLPTGQYVVQFGDNSDGARAPAQASIILTYRVGGGKQGNIDAGLIQATVRANTATGQLVSVAITNPTSASGGIDAESVDTARQRIPVHIMANQRAVTLDDYAAIATAYYDSTLGSVKYAKALTGSGNSYVEGNIVTLNTWYSSGDGITATVPLALRQAVANYVQQRCVGTDLVRVVSGATRPLPLAALIKVKAGYNQSNVEAAAVSALRAYLESLTPGSTLYQSTVLELLAAVDGVDQVALITPTSDLLPATAQEMWIDPEQAGWQLLDYMDSVTAADNVTTLTYQLPVTPVTCWNTSLRQESGGVLTNILQLYPAVAYNTALIIPTSANGLETGSFLNLDTGKLTLVYSSGTMPPDISYAITPVTTYTATKTVNVWISYTGVNNAAKRNEIRAALRAWIRNFGPGYSLYSAFQTAQSASLSNMTAVIAGIDGVTAVGSISLESPRSTAAVVTADSSELIQFGQITIQGNLN